MNSFYDDAEFYSQNNKLSTAVLGSFIKRIYYACGRLLNEKKTDLLVGSHTFKFCGFLWNSTLMKFRPLDKLLKSSNEAMDYILENENKYIYIKDMVKVIGKLVYTGHAINMMSIALAPLKAILKNLHHKYDQDEIWTKKFLVTPYLCDHIIYLKKLLSLNHVADIQIPTWDVEIVSDVSDKMAGSYDSDGVPIVVPLSDKLASSSSTLRETYGIYIALQNRLDKIKNKRVRVLVDNLGTATIIMRNSSKLYELNLQVYKIIRLCLDNNIKLWVRWLRRDMEAIQFADDLSKCVEVDRWVFDSNILLQVIQDIGLPMITIDLLADAKDRLCDRYISRFFDDNAIEFNWMKLSYAFFSGEVGFLNPPFRGDYLELSIRQIINKKINTYVVLPKWPSAIWYTMVRQYAAVIIELPEGYKYFKPPSYMTIRATKTWSIILVYFKFPRPKYQKSYRLNTVTMKVTPLY